MPTSARKNLSRKWKLSEDKWKLAEGKRKLPSSKRKLAIRERKLPACKVMLTCNNCKLLGKLLTTLPLQSRAKCNAADLLSGLSRH